MTTIGFIGVGEIASAMVEGLHAATAAAPAGGYSFLPLPAQ
jgi:pyrroline-5-carboxylate reductase